MRSIHFWMLRFLNISGKGGKMAAKVLVWRAEEPMIFTRSEAKKNVQRTLLIGQDYSTIGEEAFRGNIKLRHLSLENSITEIQREAFLNCTNMKQIEMPGVQVIRQKAFAGCVKLEKVEFMKPVRRMEKNIFAGCKRLMTMKMDQESRQSRIEEGTFRECQSLQEVQVPTNFTEIGKFAFYKCIDLSQFSFSGDLKKIGASAFYQCGISAVSLGFRDAICRLDGRRSPREQFPTIFCEKQRNKTRYHQSSSRLYGWVSLFRPLSGHRTG